MKKLAILLISVALTSCGDSKEDFAVTGEWKLIEALMDPGDGSGTFEKTSYDWFLEFHSDGTIQSSQGLCLDNSSNNGTYTDKEIKGIGCDAVYTYDIQGQYLILRHKFCIEPCAYKFRKRGGPSDM